MWREQYDRVKRWHDCFQEIESGREHTRSSNYYQDVVYAFFQNCHHLKDWLGNDTTSGVTSKDAENVINNAVELRICADLANGSKHLERNRKPRISTGTKIGQRLFKIRLSTSAATQIAVSYEVEIGSSRYDAFQLACKCLEEWDKFLKAKGLL